MHIGDQGRAIVEECTIRGHKKAHGVSAAMKGSKVTVKGCNLVQCTQNGVGAFDGEFAEVYDSSSTGCQGGGYWAQEGANLKVSGCSSEQDTIGICATERSQMTACEVAVSGSKEQGVRIVSGSKATIKTCKVLKSQSVGVLAAGPGSEVATP